MAHFWGILLMRSLFLMNAHHMLLGTQLIMFIHLGARKIHAVPWQIVSRDLPVSNVPHFSELLLRLVE